MRCPKCGSPMMIRRTYPIHKLRETTSERVCTNKDCDYRETLLETVVSYVGTVNHKSAYVVARERENGEPSEDGSPEQA